MKVSALTTVMLLVVMGALAGGGNERA